MQGFGDSPFEIMACQAMIDGRAFLQAFTYSASWQTGTTTALGATATVEVATQINADADFVIQEIVFTSTTAAGTFLATADYLLTLTLTGSGRQVMNQAQMVANIAGSYQANQFARRLTMPLLVVANSTILATLVNRTAVAANRADLSFNGFKVYYTQGVNAQGEPETGDRTRIFHVI
jgi:hypothetical protein